MTMSAGIAALEENDYYMANCRKIAETREYTTNELRNLGFEVLDSKANFIFAKHESISGMDIYTMLREKGILVRHFTDERIKDYNRITIGSKEEMEAFVDAVKEIVKGA
jgi:histidinol-phosphate aminotransferase